ncbi:MAG: DUF2219 family protein [Caulobacteraceae bacterium]|nr:DUF2219 family protein [Caulobacteraceae bacterium]
MASASPTRRRRIRRGCNAQLRVHRRQHTHQFARGAHASDGAGSRQRLRPAHIPSLAGAGYFTPRDNFSWYVFAGIEGRAVAHNIFLDGSLFRDDDPSVSSNTVRHRHASGARGRCCRHKSRSLMWSAPRSLQSRPSRNDLGRSAYRGSFEVCCICEAWNETHPSGCRYTPSGPEGHGLVQLFSRSSRAALCNLLRWSRRRATSAVSVDNSFSVNSSKQSVSIALETAKNSSTLPCACGLRKTHQARRSFGSVRRSTSPPASKRSII